MIMTSDGFQKGYFPERMENKLVKGYGASGNGAKIMKVDKSHKKINPTDRNIMIILFLAVIFAAVLSCTEEGTSRIYSIAMLITLISVGTIFYKNQAR